MAHQLLAGDRRAEGGLQQVAHAGAVQPLDAQSFGAGTSQRGHGVDELVAGDRLGRAPGDHDGERHVRCFVGEVAQQLERGGVRPVHVLQHDQERLTTCRACEQVDHGVEHPEAGSGAGVLDIGVVQQRRQTEVGRALAVVGRELAHRRQPRPQGRGVAALVAAPDEHAPAVVGGPPRHVLHEPGLADARLTGHEQELGATRRDRVRQDVCGEAGGVLTTHGHRPACRVVGRAAGVGRSGRRGAVAERVVARRRRHQVGILAQQPLLERAYLLRRVHAQLVREPLPQPAERGERVRLPCAAVLGEREQRPQPLGVGVLPSDLGGVTQRVLRTAEPEQGADALLPDSQAQLHEPVTGCPDQLAVDGGVRRTGPTRERRLRRRQGVAAVARSQRVARGRLERPRVDVRDVRGDGVAGGGAHEGGPMPWPTFRLEEATQARHGHLDRGQHTVGGLGAPHLDRETFCRDVLTVGGEQRAQHAAFAAPRHRHADPVDDHSGLAEGNIGQRHGGMVTQVAPRVPSFRRRSCRPASSSPRGGRRRLGARGHRDHPERWPRADPPGAAMVPVAAPRVAVARDEVGGGRVVAGGGRGHDGPSDVVTRPPRPRGGRRPEGPGGGTRLLGDAFRRLAQR